MPELGTGMSRRRRKSHLGSIILIIILILLIAAIGTFVWYLSQHKKSVVYLDNTIFMGENVAGRAPEDLMAGVRELVDGVDITLSEAGQPALSGKLADFGFTLDEDKVRSNLQNAMLAQKSSLGSVLRCLTGAETLIESELSMKFDEAVFNGVVQTSSLPIARRASSDASLTQNSAERRMDLVMEVYGNEFDEAQFRSWMKQQIEGSLRDNGMTDIDLAFPEELYIKPQVTAEAAGFVARAEALKPYDGAEITYEFGPQTEVLDYDTIISWLDVNGNTASVNQEKLDDWIYHLIACYNTLYRTRKFTTTKGREVTFPESDNEYGYRLNEDQERAQFLEDITSGAPVSREPVYVKTDKWDNPLYLKRNGRDDMAGTYVEVSIEDQHLWYYVDYELFLETDVVTGDVTLDRGTHTGVFPLSYKQRDYTLTGGEGSGAYETPVSYWMPFIDGQGLHDANWRSNFGGDIYMGNGSHGCVNLPPRVAEKIYDEIKAGTAIVIYD